MPNRASLIVINQATRNVLIAVILLSAFGLLLSLGTWQMQRLAWKEGLLAELDRNLKAEPLQLDRIISAANSGDDIEYKPVTVSGTFDHSKEQHFFATHEGRVGYYVYTPLTFGQGVIFINRGFVPFDFKEPITRLDGQIEGFVTITGLARKMLDHKPSFLVPNNTLEQNIYYWKDLRAMAANAELSYNDPTLVKFFIDADVMSSPGTRPGLYPIGGVTIIDLPNNHLQYAFTWYGLAATLLVVVIYYRFRKMRNLDKRVA